MKKLIIVIVVLTIVLSSFKVLNKEVYKANTEESVIEWAGSRPGKTHNGILLVSEGYFNFENNQLISGDFTLDMKSIRVLDIPQESNGNMKLVNHLSSSDFFDTQNHPTGKFIITNVESQGEKNLIKGNLTIKNIIHDVSFLATISKTDEKLVLKSDEFKIDRTKWDIRYRSGKFFDNLKNKLIYDDIMISVKIVAKK